MEKSKIKICIIEDDKFCSSLFKKVLNNLYYSNIHIYEKGYEFLGELDETVDLIIMDYYLKDIEGEVLFKEIKKTNINVPIIVVSSQQNLQVAMNFLKDGAFDYLLKSFYDNINLTEIMYKFERLLELKDNKSLSANELSNFANILVQSEENIRIEIANELHDNIAQLLLSSKLLIESALKRSNENKEFLSVSKNQLNTAIDEIRKLSRKLHYRKDEKIDLSTEIRNIFQPLKMHSELIINDKIDITQIENTISQKCKTNIIRITQEITNNCMKYAKANIVDYTLKGKGNFIQLKVSDNGIGFDQPLVKKGLGLKNIVNRIKQLSGSYNLKSSQSMGCTWEVSIPINKNLA